MRRLARGFTLLEVIITVLVMSVLGTVGFHVIFNGVEAYYATDGALSTLAKLRYATGRIVDELREVDYTDPSGPYVLTATYPSTANGSITFTKIDTTVVTIDGSTSSVTIQYDAGSAYTLTDGVSDLTFNFFQYDGTNATSASDVAFVEVNLTLLEGTSSYAQRVRVGLRDNI